MSFTSTRSHCFLVASSLKKMETAKTSSPPAFSNAVTKSSLPANGRILLNLSNLSSSTIPAVAVDAAVMLDPPLAFEEEMRGRGVFPLDEP